MKIAALSFYSANDAFAGGRAGAHSSANQSGIPHDMRRDGDRRRKARIVEAARITPQSRLTTGLALQVIAQIEKSDSASANADRVEAARSAYQRISSASGALINFRA